MIVLSTTIGGTWKVAHELFVKPRGGEIQRLNRRIVELEKREIIPRTSKEKRVIEKEPIASQESRVTGPAQRDKLIENVIPYSKAYDKLFRKGIPYPKTHD